MRKFKQFLLLLLSVGVLALGWLLPTIAAWLQDHYNTNVVQYQNIDALELELHDPEDSLGFLGKLSLQSEGQRIDIPEEQASIPSDELYGIVMDRLVPYQEAGLIYGDLSEFSYYAIPMALYSTTRIGEHAIFWTVDLSLRLDDELYYYINLTIDDSDGQIISISCHNCNPDGYIFDDPELRQEMLETFYRVYVEARAEDLLLSSGEYERSGMEYNEEMLPSDHINLRWGDLVYGEITLTFAIHYEGFYTAVSSSPMYTVTP